MRRTIFTLFLATFGTAGCALVYGVGDYHVVDAVADGALDAESGASNPDGALPDGALPPECTTNAECIARAAKEGPRDAGADADAAALVLDGGVIPAVCVKATGRCQRLLTPECTTVSGDWANEDAVLLATLFATVGTTAKTNIARQRSALLAAEEIDSTLGGGGLPPAKAGGPVRPLAVLSCETVTSLIRAATHLVEDLHVPAVIGPNLTQDTIDVTTKISAKGGTLLMSPAATSSAVAGLADQNLTWTSVPSDTQRAKLIIRSVSDLETALHPARGNNLKLAIVYRDDAFGQSTYSSVSGSLTFNTKPIADAANAAYVRTYKYLPSSVQTQTDAAAAVAATKPDVVLLFGTSESVTNVLYPLEVAMETNEPGDAVRPYYVLIDPNKVKELTDGLGSAAISTVSPLRPRVRGVGTTPEATSVPVFAEFNSAYLSRYGDNPRAPSMGPSYDSMYALAFAIAATSNEVVTGKSVARGLAGLGTGKEVAIGRTSTLSNFQKLSSGQAINPVGTFSHLKWDMAGTIVEGTLEVWCIGLAAGVPAYASSGITMDVASQSVGGTYAQCN